MGTLNEELIAVGARVAAGLGAPRVRSLYLPATVADETFRDEFGFVFLDDGSVGPFYVSLDEMLHRLWQRYPRPHDLDADAQTLLAGLGSTEPVDRGLALGSYNALSASLLRRAGFVPPDRGGANGPDTLPPGAVIGMVGYFEPLIEGLTGAGHPVWVLEKAPERVGGDPGVRLIDDPHALRDCALVLCTASTLVNDSLSDLLAVLAGQVPVELIGPSGSGLPDPLFVRGVTAVGGVSFAGREDLVAQLDAGRKWGQAGRKYRLDVDGYPGVERLLADAGVNADQP